MCLLNEQWLSSDIENPGRIPVMTSARNEVLGVKISRCSERSFGGMVAKIEPGVDTSVDKREAICLDVETAVFVEF